MCNKYPTQVPHYYPTSEDISWAKKMLELLHEDASFALQSPRLVYRVSHTPAPRLTLTTPERLEDLDAFIVHIQTIWVFEAIRYSVLPDARWESEVSLKWVC